VGDVLNGQPTDADEWNRRLRVTVETADCSANLTLATGAAVDIPGCSVTVETEVANARFIAYGVFDMQMVNTSSTTGVGVLDVDGTDESRQAIFNGLTNGARETVVQVWSGVLAAAGSHTLKLQGFIGAGTTLHVRANTPHTTLTVHVMEVA
jgi:hypothetical protein